MGVGRGRGGCQGRRGRGSQLEKKEVVKHLYQWYLGMVEDIQFLVFTVCTSCHSRFPEKLVVTIIFLCVNKYFCEFVMWFTLNSPYNRVRTQKSK